jgi:hypothetical protein
MNYTDFALRLSELVSNKVDGVNWSVTLPATIDFAEQRLYRELDLLSTIIRDSSSSLTPLNRTFSLPTDIGTFITVQSVNIITSLTGGYSPGLTADTGQRNQLVPTSRDFLDSVHNSTIGATLPYYFALLDDRTILVGPFPDNPYVIEVIGTIRPKPLSADNPITFLTLILPDLFLAAAMVFFSKAIGLYGGVPQDPQYYEMAYQTLFKSAQAEELRRKFAAMGWTSRSESVEPK